jgi:4-hydroxyacetophenone monooxygenase
LDSRQELQQAALRETDFAPLLMAYVQLSGDESALDEYGRYITGPWNWMENAPPEARRELAGKISLAMQARQAPPALPEALLRRMMSVCVGQPVPEEYADLLKHEMQLAGTRQLEVRWRKRPADATLAGFRVAIIGAGESGICAGIKLLELGIPFVILEKNETVGGTWFENDYPGCGVDTPNHFYCYSFEPNHDWSRHFSPRKELWQYLERCADKYGVRPHIRFRTEVTEAVFENHSWKIKTSQGDLAANAIICAVGQLNRPHVPDIKGLGDFAGPAFHTAQWNHAVSLKGKRVAMIGTGASGMQVGPSIAPEVERLSIFQRSPHWAIHNPNYHRTVSDSVRWALKNLPFYAQWYRFQLFWASSDGLYDGLRVDPGWPTPDLSLNAVNQGHRDNLIAHIRKEVNDDPELMRKAVPQYPPYGKRMLRDNHWYRMLTRPNVDLVTEPIGHVERDAVVTRNGVRHAAEVLILATGFQAYRMTWPMRIAGRGGRTLRELWGDDDPRAYLGITVPGFPNFFMMYGPNTNLAHGGSAIFHSECQVRYALLALREMLENGWETMDVKQAAHDAFNRRVDEIHSRMVWSHRGVGSWYKNQRGRVFATSPWRLLDYWNMTRSLELADYEFS